MTLRQALTNLGNDVLSARKHRPRSSDETLLVLARGEGRVPITEDKVFGKPVFLRSLPYANIERLCEMTPMEKTDAVRTLIDRQSAAMREGAIKVVAGDCVQIRSATDVKRKKCLANRGGRWSCHAAPREGRSFSPDKVAIALERVPGSNTPARYLTQAQFSCAPASPARRTTMRAWVSAASPI